MSTTCDEENIRKMQDILFENFMQFLHDQQQLRTADDLNPQLHYSWLYSPDKVHIGRVILWVGVPYLDILAGEEIRTAQINVEFDYDGETHVKIWKHSGELLTSGWTED